VNYGYFFYNAKLYESKDVKVLYDRISSISWHRSNGASLQFTLNEMRRYRYCYPENNLVLCEGILFPTANGFYYDYNSIHEIYNTALTNHVAIFCYTGEEYQGLYTPSTLETLANNINTVMDFGFYNFYRIDCYEHRTDIIFTKTQKCLDTPAWQKEGF